jgi:type II secretory pathway pseudopilin PulG
MDLSSVAQKRGGIIIQVIAFTTISMVLLSGFVGWATMSVRQARQTEQREQALQIAEAGIDYYRWHLAHAPTDYQDGTGTSGPYVHDYFDTQGVKIGTYSLNITPPLLGSTIVTVESTGSTTATTTGSSASRTIRAKLGKPSFAKYAVLSNSDISIGADIVGPMHSNGILYMVSGTAQNLMTSSRTTGSSSLTGGVVEWGVYSATDPNPPTGLATVTSMFLAGRDIGVPSLDFSGITVDLAQLRAAAQADGRYYAASGAAGYQIIVQANDTFDLYRVDTISASPVGCEPREWWNTPTCPHQAGKTWSINTKTLIGNDVAFPTNGIIFAEDHVWVEGVINTARLSIIAATLPDPGAGSPNRRNIIVNNDLLYTNYDGQDVIGLIAQDNFWVGLISQDDLEIDAAIIAQNGRVSRMGYKNCGTYRQQSTIRFYGMFASNQRYAYGNLGSGCTGFGTVSGYQTNRIYTYDPYLLYGPPPSFPLTTDNYQIISWEEI